MLEGCIDVTVDGKDSNKECVQNFCCIKANEIQEHN